MTTDTESIRAAWAQINEAEEAGEWSQATTIYNEITKSVERTPELIARHALAVLHAGDPARSATMTRKAARLAPTDAGIQLQLGKIYFIQSRHKEAESTFRKVLEMEPDNIDAMRRLAQSIQMERTGWKEAEKLLLKAARIEPTNIAVWQQLGAIYGNDPRRYKEAEDAFKKALKMEPNLPSAYHNLGLLRRFQADLPEAEKLLRKACELLPKDTSYAFSMGSCLMYMEQIEESLAWFKKAADLDDANIAAKVYTAFALFLGGQIREGWVQYEKRLKLKDLKDLNYSRPRWDGSDVGEQSILLLREQGYGDNLQFIRYAKYVAERSNGKVILLAQTPLLRLFNSVEGVSLTLSATPEPKYFHRFIPLMSLPYIFETDKDSIPADVPYVAAQAADIEYWREHLDSYPGLKVGVNWRGNPGHLNDSFRSSSLEEMSQLFDIPGITFFSLVFDRPIFEEELPENLIDISYGFNDFADTAAAMENLDLIITVDTSTCHLAGALARPVWTMIARGPDFRWGLNTSESPWYPTMKLFRQAVLGEWSDVYKRISAELIMLASTHNAS